MACGSPLFPRAWMALSRSDLRLFFREAITMSSRISFWGYWRIGSAFCSRLVLDLFLGFLEAVTPDLRVFWTPNTFRSPFRFNLAPLWRHCGHLKEPKIVFIIFAP